MITTTLKKIEELDYYKIGCSWEKLLKHLGKTQADDEPLKFSTIIEAIGLEGAQTCLGSISQEYDKEIRLLATDYAEAVLYLFEEEYPNDKRPRLAIESTRAFVNGEISKNDLDAARSDAWNAKWMYPMAAAARAAATAAEDAAFWDAYQAAISSSSSSIRAIYMAYGSDNCNSARATQGKLLTERFS